jgi:hypothetical protein
MRPEDYIRLRKNAEALLETVQTFRGKTKMPRASELRPATAQDIVAGTVVFFPDAQPPSWEEVADRLTDQAFLTRTRLRCELQHAFVRKT